MSLKRLPGVRAHLAFLLLAGCSAGGKDDPTAGAGTDAGTADTTVDSNGGSLPPDSEPVPDGDSTDTDVSDTTDTSDTATTVVSCVAVARWPDRWTLDMPRDVTATVTFSAPLDLATVHEASFVVTGDVTGFLPGAVTYDPDLQEATFTPKDPAHPGERLTAVLTGEVACANGTHPGPLVWTWTASAGGDGTLREADATVTGDYSYGIVAHDLDGDGALEMITAEAEEGRVTVIGGTPGAFSATQRLDVLGYPDALDGGDVDADGDVDILVATSGGVGVMENDAGRLLSPTLYGDGASCMPHVTAGDLDGDGDLDIVTGAPWNGMTVHLNDGTGTFTFAQEVPLTYLHNSFAHDLGDVDGDDDLDVLLVVQPSNTPGYAMVLQNDGTGLFTALSPISLGYTPKALYLNDLDGDGDVDAAVPMLYEDDIFVLQGDGLGGFTPVVVATYAGGHGICGGDLDGDGDIDLAVPGFQDLLLVTFENDGAGGFTLSNSLPLPERGTSVVCADLDGNGSVDVGVAAVTTPEWSEVVTFLNGE